MGIEGIRVSLFGFGFWVSGFGFGFWVLGFGFRVSVFGFRVSGFRFGKYRSVMPHSSSAFRTARVQSHLRETECLRLIDLCITQL